MRSTRSFESASMYILNRLMSFTLVSLFIGSSILGCGSSSGSNNGPPLDVAGTWTGSYDQAGSNGGPVYNVAVTVTLTATQNGNSVSYAGTLTNGATWDCQNGTIKGTTITFPSCTVTYSDCTATVTNRKDVIDDKVTPWTMSPSYSYKWSGTCSVTGYTVTVPVSGGTAVLSKQ